jgi:hypothetical protein
MAEERLLYIVLFVFPGFWIVYFGIIRAEKCSESCVQMVMKHDECCTLGCGTEM